MNCVSLSGRIIKNTCVSFRFLGFKAEMILGITCYKMSLIEAPNVAFHKAKAKERKEL